MIVATTKRCAFTLMAPLPMVLLPMGLLTVIRAKRLKGQPVMMSLNPLMDSRKALVTCPAKFRTLDFWEVARG